jgi:hypothetical protein
MRFRSSVRVPRHVSDHARDVIPSRAGSNSLGHARALGRAELVGSSSLLIRSNLRSRGVVGSGPGNLKFSEISIAGLH